MSKGRALSKAQKLLQKRRFSEVIRICDKVLAGLGRPLAEGEDEQAIRCFFSSLEEFTQVAMAYGQLLDCSPRLAKKSLLWIGNTPAEAALLKGYAYLELGEYAKAAYCLERALHYHPENPDYLNELGFCYERMAEHDRALTTFRQALEASRGIASPALRAVVDRARKLGGELLAAGQTAAGKALLEGAEVLREAVCSRHRQAEARALRGIGFQLIELGRLDEAEQAFRESLEVEPNNECALHELQVISGLRLGGTTGSGPPAR